MSSSPKLKSWLKNQASRKEEVVLIERALLTGRMAKYYLFRLRYFLLKCFVGIAIATIELRILLIGFAQDASFLRTSISAGAVALCISAFWWAGSELMRENIRKTKRGETGALLIPRILILWRRISFKVAGTLAFLFGLIALGNFFADGKINSVDFYLIALAARVCITIPLRTFHSSVYATRRIYKPLGWILAAEVVGFAFFLWLHPIIGGYAVGATSLITLAASSGITYHFTKKAFNHLGYGEAFAKFKAKPKKLPPAPSPWEFTKRAIPYALMRFDIVLVVLALLNQIHQPSLTLSSFALLALCIPLLNVTKEWGELLYFDYKKTEVHLFRRIREEFEKGLGWIPPILGVALWLIAWPAVYLTEHPAAPPWQLLALLVASGYLSQQTIRLFSLGNYRQLTLWALSLLICTAAVLFTPSQATLAESLGWVAGILGLHAAAMAISFRYIRIPLPGREVIPPTIWMRSLKRNAEIWGSVQAGIVELQFNEDDEPGYIRRAVSRNTRLRLREKKQSASFTSLQHNTLVFFAKPDIANLENTIRLCGGTQIKRVRLYQGTAEEIRVALGQHEKALQPPKEDPKILEGETPLVFCFDKTNPDYQKRTLGLSSDDYQTIFYNGVQFHYSIAEPKRRGKYDVTSLEKDGAIQSFYAWPIKRLSYDERKAQKEEGRRAPSANQTNRTAWRRYITQENLEDAWQCGAKDAEEKKQESLPTLASDTKKPSPQENLQEG